MEEWEVVANRDSSDDAINKRPNRYAIRATRSVERSRYFVIS